MPESLGGVSQLAQLAEISRHNPGDLMSAQVYADRLLEEGHPAGQLMNLVMEKGGMVVDYNPDNLPIIGLLQRMVEEVRSFRFPMSPHEARFDAVELFVPRGNVNDAYKFEWDERRGAVQGVVLRGDYFSSYGLDDLINSPWFKLVDKLVTVFSITVPFDSAAADFARLRCLPDLSRIRTLGIQSYSFVTYPELAHVFSSGGGRNINHVIFDRCGFGVLNVIPEYPQRVHSPKELTFDKCGSIVVGISSSDRREIFPPDFTRDTEIVNYTPLGVYTQGIRFGENLLTVLLEECTFDALKIFRFTIDHEAVVQEDWEGVISQLMLWCENRGVELELIQT